jgi:thiol:disulfide interchange protein
MKKATILFSLLSISCNLAFAQVYNPVHWSFSSRPVSGSVFELTFTATIDKGWHMYGLNIPGAGPIPTSFTFSDNKNIEYISELTAVKAPVVKFDATFEMDVELFGGQTSFTRRVKVLTREAATLGGFVEFMACDDSRCLPPKEEPFEFLLKPSSSAIQDIIKKDDAPAKEPAPVFENSKPDITSDTTAASAGQPETMAEPQKTLPGKDQKSTGDKSLIRLFLLALLAGFGALLTPCVYPIIPLTVSFFMRDTSRSKALFNGLVFGLSIILIYTFVGLIVGLLKVDLVRLVSSHWIPNLIFFLIFLALAFSFFGMFEIMLPGSLSNKIDQQAEKGGFLGPFFMALATVIISFSCTGPIVGVVLGSAMQGEIIKPVVGMLGFSISFALPFTLLALFPGFMKKLPKSGGWLNSVKVFFAFILLAFSLVFLGNMGLKFITRDVILAMLIVIFILLGLYLLGKIRFAHDSPQEHVSVLRLILAIASFAFAVYMIPGLFGAPLKAVSPFLPPQEEMSFNLAKIAGASQSSAVTAETADNVCTQNPKYSDILQMPLGLKGYFDYDEALDCARELNKPVLLDFAGHSCKNCKKMYAEVWSDPEVLKRLKNDFVIAILYTDDRNKLPEEDQVTSSLDGKVKNTIGKKFNDLQVTKFSTNALPLYAIVDAEGNVLTEKAYYTYSPYIKAFIDFLDEGVTSFKE